MIDKPAIPVALAFLQRYSENTSVRTEIEEALANRHYIGLAKYGVPLTPNNGRNSYKDIYEELLDAYIYSTNILLERGHDPSTADYTSFDEDDVKLFKLLITTLDSILFLKENFPCN